MVGLIKKMFGEFLVEEGVISTEQLDMALKTQKLTGNSKLLGEIIRDMRLVSDWTYFHAVRKYNLKVQTGTYLLWKGYITEDQLKDALSRRKLENIPGRIGEVLVLMGYLTEYELIEAMSTMLGFEKKNPDLSKIDEAATKSFGYDFCKKNNVLILQETADNDDPGGIPNLAACSYRYVIMSDPMDQSVISEIERKLKCPIEPAIAYERDIEEHIEILFKKKDERSDIKVQFEEEVEFDTKDLTMDRGLDAVQAVKFILQHALRKRASDIHIEPQEKKLIIRYRIDGQLNYVHTYGSNIKSTIISHVKALVGLDVAKRKEPQDGRTKINFLGERYEVRSSSMPTYYGEKIVLRLLKPVKYTLENVGFTPSNLSKFRQQLDLPNGLILAVGPTGCGKSTLLYAALSYLNKEFRSISTIEDPVEIPIVGVNQTQYNERVGTFTDNIRAMLRQDPDVMMIGEVRDREAAQALVDATLTGHLILSTYHTDDTVGALLRLRQMGIETYLISNTVVSVCSQRLVRRLCEECKEEYTPTPGEFAWSTVDPKNLEDYTFYKAKGCGHCNGTGYFGRTAIHELLVLNEEIRDAIIKEDNRPTASLRVIARQTSKYLTMQQDGIFKTTTGLTSIDEVKRMTNRLDREVRLVLPLPEIVRICNHDQD